MLVRRRLVVAASLVATLALTGCGHHPKHTTAAPASAAGGTASGAPSPSVSVAPPAAAPPAPGLKTIDYSPAPKGFPADPAISSTAPLTEGVHPTKQLPVYDAPGGTAKAYLASTISTVPVVVPVVAHQPGWAAVLLPSVNRTIGWLPDGGYETVALHDQLVLHRQTHQFVWYRDGALQGAWTVTIGAPATQTPLGRTFVLGRSRMVGKVYAGLDGLALGAVPDDPSAVATGLAGAHIGIHSWYQNTFGRNISNGCIRVPPAGQTALLGAMTAGAEVVVLDA